MPRALLIVLAAFLLPTSALAAHAAIAPASFKAAQSLVAASSSPGNSYVMGASVVLTAPVTGDFSAIGGSVITAAPVMGDDLILAGSIHSRASVAGDLRCAGGSIDISKPVLGDLIALGFSVQDSGRADGSVFIAALDTTLTAGASGPVTIYGNNISLAGDFAGDVTVVSSGRLALAPGTTIHGKLVYEAPDVATLPASATVVGGITYTNASYLPDLGTSRLLAFVSIGFFLIARIIGALILAGLLAGLFPMFAEAFIERAYTSKTQGRLLSLLLGFAVFVATPIVIVLLMLTFVGVGLALLMLILYALLALLALVYAGILAGGIFTRMVMKREQVLWHDGVVGMTALSLVALVPYIGLPIVFLAALFAAGMLLQMFFQFAFPYDNRAPEAF